MERSKAQEEFNPPLLEMITCNAQEAMKTAHRSKDRPSADSQQGHEDFILILTKTWIWPTVWVRLKGFPGDSSGKEFTCQCRKRRRLGFNPWVRKIPWNRKWYPTPVFLPGQLHGQRSLMGYSPCSQKCRIQMKWLSTHLSDVVSKSIPRTSAEESNPNMTLI